MCNPFKVVLASALALSAVVSCGTLNQDVGVATVAINDVLCVLNVYSTEVQGGFNPVQAGIDAASKCNVAENVASQILGSHVAAEERELRPMTDAGGLVDAKAAILVKPTSK
jgi:hypothetical protein